VAHYIAQICHSFKDAGVMHNLLPCTCQKNVIDKDFVKKVNLDVKLRFKKLKINSFLLFYEMNFVCTLATV
jgi:hypothetical protein